jgi:hypothetical protein
MDTKMTIILAVDPGEHAGIAVYSNGSYLESQPIPGDHVKLVEQFLMGLLARFKIDLLVLEAQFLRFPKGFRTLCRRADIWYVLTERLDIPVCWVEPSKWMCYYRIKGGEGKEGRLIKAAKEIHSKNEMTSDEAAAILIGNYYLKASANGTLNKPKRPKRKKKKKVKRPKRKK